MTPDGPQAVLMDLGLAQLADESEGRLTRTRQFVGTLRYASPEQVLSVPLDRRSDVYSLGATLWELLTLRPLFGATDQTPTPELMLKIQHADPERPRRLNPRVPEDLEAIVLKCLEKDRAPALRHGGRAGRRPVALAARRAGAGAAADARLPAGQVAPPPPRGGGLSVAVLLTFVVGGVAVVMLARQRAASAVHEASVLAATGALERAISHFNQDRTAEGMLWLARALKKAPPDAKPLGSRIRTYLSGYRSQIAPLKEWFVHKAWLEAMAFSPDGRSVAIAGQGGAARLWDIATGSPIGPPLAQPLA